MEYDIYKYPRNFFVNITGCCNLKCIYCSSTDFNKANSMPKEKLVHIIEELKKLGAFKVIITGGEPLLHPDFEWTIMQFAEFSSVSVNTNGILLSKYIPFFREFKFKKRLTFNVSLDSLFQNHNSKTRGMYEVDNVLSNIIILHEMGYSTNILCTVTSFLRKEDILEFKKFSKKFPGIGIALNDLKLTGRAAVSLKSLLPNLDIIKFINEELSGFQNFNYNHCADHDYIAPLLSCGAGKECLSINESGDVFPCTAMYIKVGNIFENTIKEMCDCSEIIKKLNTMRCETIDSINECKNCEYLHRCSGGCRANAFIATDNLYGVDPYCWHSGKYFKGE